MADEFFFCGMTGLFDYDLKRGKILFFQPLKFACQDVPRVNKPEEMPVSFNDYGAVTPIGCTPECQRIADLNKIIAFVLGPAMRLHKPM